MRRDETRDLVIREVLEAEILHQLPVVGEAYTSDHGEVRSADTTGNARSAQSRILG